MIKTIITPQNNSIQLVIPNNYIGKEIEVLVYTTEEITEPIVKQKKSITDFCGTLSKVDFESLNIHTQNARKEWNRNI